MAPGKAPCRRRSSDSGVEPDRGALPRDREQRTALSQKKRDQRIALFLSDFDQQDGGESVCGGAADDAGCRQEDEKERDLQGREEVALAAAVTDCSVEDMPNPKLVRTNSKKVKVTTIVEYEDAKHSSAKKITKKISKTRSLVSLASGISGKLNSLSSATNLKATPKGAKSAGLQQTVSRTLPASGRVQSMLKRSKSVPQHKSVPFVNIPLADGQTLCTAGGDLRNIDVQLLNQDTVQYIHKLVSELTVLCGKVTPKPS
ncbi:borealin-2-like isoform X3 [Onychostruthus taczanowskii]|uniref:borealin-2-like isoform X3 n=1 Tax=Onychostruthus taczanowskii TaxID=356909 RepID=UPI001B800A1F|nr:borealin-2-like isoform X3 [Onychostruthus taczanowskii]